MPENGLRWPLSSCSAMPSPSVSVRIMRKPTMMSAGAVALAGTTPAIGEKNMATANRMAMMTPTQPVRPPTPTPAPDSI